MGNLQLKFQVELKFSFYFLFIYFIFFFFFLKWFVVLAFELWRTPLPLQFVWKSEYSNGRPRAASCASVEGGRDGDRHVGRPAQLWRPDWFLPGPLQRVLNKGAPERQEHCKLCQAMSVLLLHSLIVSFPNYLTFFLFSSIFFCVFFFFHFFFHSDKPLVTKLQSLMLSKSDFELLKVIGRGAFGEVSFSYFFVLSFFFSCSMQKAAFRSTLSAETSMEISTLWRSWTNGKCSGDKRLAILTLPRCFYSQDRTLLLSWIFSRLPCSRKSGRSSWMQTKSGSQTCIIAFKTTSTCIWWWNFIREAICWH